MAHIRDNSSVLAAAEKRLLVRIARKLPTSITSDHLSALALFVDAGSRRGVRLHFALALVRRPHSSCS